MAAVINCAAAANTTVAKAEPHRANPASTANASACATHAVDHAYAVLLNSDPALLLHACGSLILLQIIRGPASLLFTCYNYSTAFTNSTRCGAPKVLSLCDLSSSRPVSEKVANTSGSMELSRWFTRSCTLHCAAAHQGNA